MNEKFKRKLRIIHNQFEVDMKRTCLFPAILLLVAGLFYLSLFVQEMLIFPSPISSEETAVSVISKNLPKVERVSLMNPDGILLTGWFLPASTTGAAPALIQFTGNAEQSIDLLSETSMFAGWSVLTMDYQGYGTSQGEPSEEALVADALFCYDWLLSRPDVDKTRIVALGRSLGAGVAVALAEQRKLRGVILVSPFDTLLSVAQEAYPYVPMGFLLQHPFDSLSRAKAIHTTALVVVAEKDAVISPEHTWRLVDGWAGDVTAFTLPEVGHDDVKSAPAYWPVIGTFLNKMEMQTDG
ncbi:MAG: alpha/beta hydrolase [Magnetococcus sp. YQC-3]